MEVATSYVGFCLNRKDFLLYVWQNFVGLAPVVMWIFH